MRSLSKSRLLAYRQCPKRLWLEVHRAELRDDARASFALGRRVGEIARRLYDPQHAGTLIDVDPSDLGAALAQTRERLDAAGGAPAAPLFEAAFAADGALALVDVLVPERSIRGGGWRMVEVKSTSSVKRYHLDDVAIQSFVAQRAGLPLSTVAIAHVDTNWTYPGDDAYDGLLTEVDLTAHARARAAEVGGWIAEAQRVASRAAPPPIATGAHCNTPFACGFIAHCSAGAPRAEYPIEWLPAVQSRRLREHIARADVTDLRDVPDALLSESQRRVKTHTLADTVWFDAQAAHASLHAHSGPASFVDFETIAFAVPIWKGTRPYQHVPFQFSCQRLDVDGQVSETPFLDLGGEDPSPAFARALVAACGERGAIFVYNRAFEAARVRELAQRFAGLRDVLRAIEARLVDLAPIVRACYYHPTQRGSWSLKAVLPAIAPDLHYDQLDGVRDGGGAQAAYAQAIDPATPTARRRLLETQLLAYCRLDTFAMVRIWQAMTGVAPSAPPSA